MLQLNGVSANRRNYYTHELSKSTQYNGLKVHLHWAKANTKAIFSLIFVAA